MAKTTAKKATKTKTTTKKAAPKKAATKKVATKKTAAKKTVAKKPAVKKAPAKKAVVKKAVVKKVAPKTPANTDKKVIAKTAPAKSTKAGNDNTEFVKDDFVVYPAHGVGRIEGVETAKIGGMEVRLYAVNFEKERMRLKIPVMKAEESGLRRLSTNKHMKDAIDTLKGRARIRRTMWSRRAQEYETKINSGDPVAIAEVLRDLKRSNDESEQSYSERQIYQSALERLAREVAAVQNITEIKAAAKLEKLLGTAEAKKAA